MIKTLIVLVPFILGLSSFAKASCEFTSGTFKIKKGQNETFSPPKKIALTTTCDSTGKMTSIVARYQGPNWADGNDGWTSYTIVFECREGGCKSTRTCYQNGYCEPHNAVENWIEVIDRNHLEFTLFYSSIYDRQ